MAGWPAGSHLVLQSKVNDDDNDSILLYAIGYKYNKKKTISFVATPNTGHTKPGVPYEAKWRGVNGEMMVREVPHPHLISQYFKHSNAVDTHNHLRQGELGLEKQWVTHDGFFRIITTLFGIVVTDAFLVYRHQLPTGHHHKNLSIKRFSDMLCSDLLHNNFPSVVPDDSVFLPADDENKNKHERRKSRHSPRNNQQSNLPYCEPSDCFLQETCVKIKEGGTTRRKRRLCEIGLCAASNIQQKKKRTSKVCSLCSPSIFICGAECLHRHRSWHEAQCDEV